MVRTPQAHLGSPSLSPPPAACSWLGATLATLRATLGSLGTRGTQTCTLGPTQPPTSARSSLSHPHPGAATGPALGSRQARKGTQDSDQ